MGNLDNTEHALSRKCNSNLFLAACSEVPSPNWLHSASPSWVPQGHLQTDGAVLVSELINCTHTYSMSGTGIQGIFACICTTLSHLQRDSILCHWKSWYTCTLLFVDLAKGYNDTKTLMKMRCCICIYICILHNTSSYQHIMYYYCTIMMNSNKKVGAGAQN